MKSLTIGNVIQRLNALLGTDNEAVENLLNLRVNATRIDLRFDEFIPYNAAVGVSLMGLIEVLNFLYGDEGIIIPVFDGTGKLQRFRADKRRCNQPTKIYKK